jgi:hypothetical protein
MALIEIFAALCGLAGTLLLATKGLYAGWGFVAFLASNAGWLAFSAAHGHWAMFAQQVGFTGSSLVGIWVWLIKGKA